MGSLAEHSLAQLCVGHGQTETLKLMLHQSLVAHLLKHIFLHLGGVYIGVTALLQLLLLLLHAALKFHII